jgi:ATP-dependent DNA helicase RecQ
VSGIHKILKDFWHYDSFRPLQEDIINSALQSKDTLALLPTGGGKSICFQIPAIAKEGTALVVSPLIALMADQVQNLKERGINAIALNSSLSPSERELALQNAANGYYKFIYISPESIANEKFLNRLQYINLNFIVVDEAHCISQWGYDFRPSYLNIKTLRDLKPDLAVIALTATATPEVVIDIQEKLAFKNGRVFQKSFLRPELSYNIRKTENKMEACLEILNSIPGSAIIYLRNRKGVVEISKWLRSLDYSAEYYHAGLSAEKRQLRQNAWLKNDLRIMVSTNAFGMGIDKSDVRVVLHLDLPDSLEAYFQEAGRAARDGNKAYSIILVGPYDVKSLKARYLDSFPDRDYLIRVYRALINYLQIATGSEEGSTFGIDLNDFANQYRFSPFKLYHALRILNKESVLEFSERAFSHSRIMLKADRRTLYDYQIKNPQMDLVLKMLTRSYGGLDIEYVRIDENLMVRRLDTSVYNLKSKLKELDNPGMISYIEASNEAAVSLLQERTAAKDLFLSAENIEFRKAELTKRIAAVENLINSDSICRTKTLLHYFGEELKDDCLNCDVCRAKKRLSKSKSEKDIEGDILKSIKSHSISLGDFEKAFGHDPKYIEILRALLKREVLRIENDTIEFNRP